MTLQQYKEHNKSELDELWFSGRGVGYDSFEGFCFAMWQGSLKNVK